MKKILIITFVFIALFTFVAIAQDNIEKKKIEFLISSVQNLKGAKFIRNGAEHDCVEAAKHLRLKLEKAGNRVKTANDFIRLCASKSYITGTTYIIKFPDGKTITSEKYLREKLREYSSTGKN
ncbi:hypothetical protein ASZ90_006257 [hydrocarbon metagenome]|uniref:Uncharacterized protein n=1 Tax=hydrocarbon metagenome TaxID=938273 RepID=A0A0W8FSV4_9ZZZZ